MSRSVSSCRLPLGAGGLVLTSILLAGCGGSPNGLGTVEGKVTVDGTPANAGSVVFASARGETISGVIQPDGTYRAVGVPVGLARVSVTPPPQRAPGAINVKGMDNMPGSPAPSGKSVRIPRKYTSNDSSGLSTEIKSGANQFDVQMTSK